MLVNESDKFTNFLPTYFLPYDCDTKNILSTQNATLFYYDTFFFCNSHPSPQKIDFESKFLRFHFNFFKAVKKSILGPTFQIESGYELVLVKNRLLSIVPDSKLMEQRNDTKILETTIAMTFDFDLRITSTRLLRVG